jgi:hypothetical protein
MLNLNVLVEKVILLLPPTLIIPRIMDKEVNTSDQFIKHATNFEQLFHVPLLLDVLEPLIVY